MQFVINRETPAVKQNYGHHITAQRGMIRSTKAGDKLISQQAERGPARMGRTCICPGLRRKYKDAKRALKHRHI